MYSYAQCTVQERLVCCGDVPCLAHMEQGSGPLHSEHLPPSPSAWGNRDSVYWQPSRRMYLDGGVEIRSQPYTDPVIPDNVRDIIFILSRKLSLECLSNDCLPSTDCCYIFRLINHEKGKRISYVHSSYFPGLCREQSLHHFIALILFVFQR
jgi:hypothetical protein